MHFHFARIIYQLKLAVEKEHTVALCLSNYVTVHALASGRLNNPLLAE